MPLETFKSEKVDLHEDQSALVRLERIMDEITSSGVPKIDLWHYHD